MKSNSGFEVLWRGPFLLLYLFHFGLVLKAPQPQQGNFELSGLNKGRRVFDAILEGLKVAGRFNKKAGDLGRKLGSFDTAITRGSNISRDLGVNSKYITNERRGGG